MARQSMEEILLCDETRVILRNVIFIANIPWILCNDKILSSQKYFGQFGHINQVCVSKSYHDNINSNNNTANFGAAYIQYYDAQSAMDAINTFNNRHNKYPQIRHKFRVNYAVNKLCGYFLNNEECPNANCRYIHYEPNPNDIVYQSEIDQYFHGQQRIIDNAQSTAPNHDNNYNNNNNYRVNVDELYFNLERDCDFNNDADEDQIDDDIDTPSETSPKPFLFPMKPSFNQFVEESVDTITNNNNDLHRYNNNNKEHYCQQIKKRQSHLSHKYQMENEIELNQCQLPESKRMDSVLIENQIKFKQNSHNRYQYHKSMTNLKQKPLSPTASANNMLTCKLTDDNMDHNVNDLHIKDMNVQNNGHKMEYNELEKEHMILKNEHDRLRKKHCKLIRDYNILEQLNLKYNISSHRHPNIDKNRSSDYKSKCSKLEEKLKQMSEANNMLTAHLMHQHKNYQILEHENLWLKHELETSQKSQTELSELMFNINTDNQSSFNYASLSPSRCPSITGNIRDNDVSLNMNDIKQWDWLNIYQWINSLRNGKFIKYNHSLSISLRQENVDGLMLITLNQNDLYRLGINNHNDCSLLMDDIRSLLNNNNLNNRKYDKYDDANDNDNDFDPFDLNQFRDVLNVAIVNDIEGDLFSNTFEIEGGILV